MKLTGLETRMTVAFLLEKVKLDHRHDFVTGKFLLGSELRWRIAVVLQSNFPLSNIYGLCCYYTNRFVIVKCVLNHNVGIRIVNTP
jgi:hypothetical protein